MSDIPKILKLGLIPADTEYTAVFEVLCDNESEITGTEKKGCVSFSPEKLAPGQNTVKVTVSPLRNETILYTDAIIAGQKVIITAEAAKSGYEEQNRVVRNVGNAEKEESEKLYLTRYADGKYGETDEIVLVRGLHIPLSGRTFEASIVFEPDGKPHDIDTYVFIHDGSGTLKSPSDLIFFGNDMSKDHAVSYLNAPDKRAVYIEFAKLGGDTRQLDFVFSFYENGEIFSRLKNCAVKINDGEKKMYLPLSENAGAIVAFDITKKDGGFVLNPLIMPFKKGIDTLCRNYGLKVK
jgi:stress response protein SCP2